MVNKKQKLIIFTAIVILAGSWFIQKALAGYYTSGNLISTNLLAGQTVSSIDSFVYNLSAKPAGTGATVGFNQNGGSTWYNAAGSVGTETLVTGGAQTITLTSGWSGPNFYYKAIFTSDGTGTPVLDDITVNYTSNTAPTITSVSDSPDPQAGGFNITFTSVASDPNSGNTIKLYVCKAANCANCLPGTITNCWAVSASGSTTNPSAIYSVPASCDYSANNYWAKVCDQANACSGIIGQ